MSVTDRRIRESGASLLELLVVMLLITVATGIAGVYLQPAAAPLDSSAVLLERMFTSARAKATATTSAYRIAPVGPSRIIADYAQSCSDEIWTFDTALELDLPDDVTLQDTSWSVCFSSRGAANANLVVSLQHPYSGLEQVEVYTGGAARVVR